MSFPIWTATRSLESAHERAALLLGDAVEEPAPGLLMAVDRFGIALHRALHVFSTRRAALDRARRPARHEKIVAPPERHVVRGLPRILHGVQLLHAMEDAGKTSHH